MSYYVKHTAEYGRGLYATRHISTLEIIEIAELLVFSPEDTVKVNATDLQYYTFVFNDKQDCLVLGNGEIFNHSDTPNIKYDLVWLDDRYKMVFTAISPIKPGEQLFIDYSRDTKVDSKQYVGKNLVE